MRHPNEMQPPAAAWQEENESLTFVAEGKTFTVGRLAPRRAVRMAIRIGKILGPALAGAVGDGAVDLIQKQQEQTDGEEPKQLGMGDMDFDFGRGISMLFDRLNEREFDEIHDLFLWNATCDGRPLVQNFDSVYKDNPLLSLFVLSQAMKHTYGSFSSMLARVVASYTQGLQAGKASRSKSPHPLQTSGQSGDL